MSVSFDDGTIYARSEAKVIRINDQAAHRDSLAGRAGEPVTVAEECNRSEK